MAKSKDKERERERSKKSKKRHRDEEEESGGHKKHKHRKNEKQKASSSKKSSQDASSSNRDNKKDKRRKKETSRERGSSSKSSDKKKGKKEDGDGRTDTTVEAEIQISEKDYFTRAMEFKVWLFHKKKTYFEDLTSTKSHELFNKFVKDWNRGQLDPHFYEGRLPEELIARTKKSQHKWGFVRKLTDRDQMQLELANDSVHSSTEKVKGVASNVPVLPVGSTASRGEQPDRGSNRGTGGGGGGGDDSGRRTEIKRQRRQEKDKHNVVLDEIAPKETGRQAIMDKRREVGARTHAAARAREDAADGLDMRETDTMGGGDNFHDHLARVKNGQRRRQAAQTGHLQDLVSKEEEKRAAFMAQMGLKPGQKITIQPRRDG